MPKQKLTSQQMQEYIEFAAYYAWLARGEGEEKIPGNAVDDWNTGKAQIEELYTVCDEQSGTGTGTGSGTGTGTGTTGIVSFAADIRPLFREIDINHMESRGVLLGDYAYMSDATDNRANAREVLRVLRAKEMPPGGPFWGQSDLDLLARWIAAGCPT